jgi:hypothetical protein
METGTSNGGHFTTTKFLHVPSRFWVIWITGHKLDFCWISMEKYAVTLSYLFSGPVLESQNIHVVLDRAVELLLR